jgi:DNA-binding response OmpR family regulator
MVEVLAEAKDIQVFAAASGAEALEVLDREDIQIVLLDVIMPGMGGLAVCRKIRDNPRTASVQIVLLSGFDEKRDLDELFSLGADDFISKPIAPLELHARVQAALIRYKSQASWRTPVQQEQLSNLKAENVNLRQKYNQIRSTNQELEKNNQ